MHRKTDEVKRKGRWISKLQNLARLTVQTSSTDHFSSSKGAAHSEAMKKRALEKILPSIFEVAQAYEDHIMQYNLIEGSGNKDPGQGSRHTWQPIPRPIRGQQRKRPRRNARSERVPEAVHDASGDETEPDDTMTRLAEDPRSRILAFSSPESMTPQAAAKVSTLSYTQPTHQATAATSFEDRPCQFTNNYANFAPALPQNTPTLANQFTMFNVPVQRTIYDPYKSPMPAAPGYLCEQDFLFPTSMSHHNTPVNMPMTPNDGGTMFCGLFADYSVDPQRVHQF